MLTIREMIKAYWPIPFGCVFVVSMGATLEKLERPYTPDPELKLQLDELQGLVDRLETPEVKSWWSGLQCEDYTQQWDDVLGEGKSSLIGSTDARKVLMLLLPDEFEALLNRNWHLGRYMRCGPERVSCGSFEDIWLDSDVILSFVEGTPDHPFGITATSHGNLVTFGAYGKSAPGW